MSAEVWSCRTKTLPTPTDHRIRDPPHAYARFSRKEGSQKTDLKFNQMIKSADKEA